MKDILLLVGAGYLGWYLALNEKEATLNALKQAKKEALKLKDELLVEAKKNEQLNQILDGMRLRKGFDGETTKRYEKPRIKQLRPRAI